MNKKIGAVAYEMELLQGRKINNVFHVSCLKKALGQHVRPIEALPPMDEDLDVLGLVMENWVL